MLSKPECTANYLGLFQTDFVKQLWFNLLREVTKVQEQVPRGSQGHPAFPEESNISFLSPILWHIPALQCPSRCAQSQAQSSHKPCVCCKPSPSFIPQGWGTGTASSLWNTMEKHHQPLLASQTTAFISPLQDITCISQVLC